MSGLLLSGVSTDSRTGSPCYLKHARLSVSEISKPAAGKYFYLLLLIINTVMLVSSSRLIEDEIHVVSDALTR